MSKSPSPTIARPSPEPIAGEPKRERVMTVSSCPFVANELVACMSTARPRTVQELFALAERMWVEGATCRSALSWNNLASDASDRVLAQPGAQAALIGTEPLADQAPPARPRRPDSKA